MTAISSMTNSDARPAISGSEGQDTELPPIGPRETSQLVDYGLVVLLAAIFGASFSLTKVGLETITPWTQVAGRLCIGAMIMLVVMRAFGQKLPAPGPIWKFIVLAALSGNAIPFFLISWGQEKVDAGLAAILMATMPLITISLAHIVTHDEKLGVFKVAGFLLGFAGVVTLFGLDKLAGLDGDTVHIYAIVGGAFCYAINALLSRHLVGGVPRFSMVAALMLVSVLFVVPVAFVFEAPMSLTPSRGSLVAVVLLAIFPTVIGALMVLVIIKRQGASFLSQINFMVPVFGVIWSVILVNEVPPTRAILALFIILCGVGLARVNRPFNLFKSREETKS